MPRRERTMRRRYHRDAATLPPRSVDATTVIARRYHRDPSTLASDAPTLASDALTLMVW
jgi:hypothetical protein